MSGLAIRIGRKTHDWVPLLVGFRPRCEPVGIGFKLDAAVTFDLSRNMLNSVTGFEAETATFGGDR